MDGDVVTWWDTPEWQRYEVACGDDPGTRARLLAESDWMTRVVDLSLSEAELWMGVRKSYRSLIHKVGREHDVFVWNAETGYPEIWMREYRLLHVAAAGRATRVEATWALMSEWLADGHGLLVGACQREPQEWRAFVFCVAHEAWAYYHSGASVEDNLSHALIWTAMQALKARGVRWFELGWQGEAKDNKGKQIEFFKRGWPGKDIPARDAPRLSHVARGDDIPANEAPALCGQ